MICGYLHWINSWPVEKKRSLLLKRKQEKRKARKEAVAAMKEKDPSIEPVAIMARTEGYQYLRDYIKEKIKSNLARPVGKCLLISHRLPSCKGIRSLEAVLDYVNTRVKEIGRRLR